MIKKYHFLLLLLAFIVSHVFFPLLHTYAQPAIDKIIVSPSTIKDVKLIPYKLDEDAVKVTVIAYGEDVEYQWGLNGPGKIENITEPTVRYLPPQEATHEQAILNLKITDKNGELSPPPITFVFPSSLESLQKDRSDLEAENEQLKAAKNTAEENLTTIKNQLEVQKKVNDNLTQEIQKTKENYEEQINVLKAKNFDLIKENAELRAKFPIPSSTEPKNCEQEIAGALQNNQMEADTKYQELQTQLTQVQQAKQQFENQIRNIHASVKCKDLLIQQHLEKAEKYFKDDGYTTPRGANAFSEYVATLTLDIANSKALNGLHKILSRYKILGDGFYRNDEWDNAEKSYWKYLMVGYYYDIMKPNIIGQELDEIKKRLKGSSLPPQEETQLRFKIEDEDGFPATPTYEFNIGDTISISPLNVDIADLIFKTSDSPDSGTLRRQNQEGEIYYTVPIKRNARDTIYIYRDNDQENSIMQLKIFSIDNN